MDDVLLKYCDYAIVSPDFFINFIQGELATRDLDGLTNGRIKAINVTGEHPLVQLTGSVMNTGKADFAGLLPSISVGADEENEENTTLGQGLRQYYYVVQDMIDRIKVNPMRERIQDGMITDNQLQTLQIQLDRATAIDQKMIIETHEYFITETIFVSLWAHTTQERKILGMLLRSILFDMKKAMISKRLFDFTQRTTGGLVNFNFGQMIFGSETTITYRHPIRNYTVYKPDVVPASDDFRIQGTYKEWSPGTGSVTIYEDE